MEDKLKQSEQAREQLAKELVRTKVSLECADNTIKKQQENIEEFKAENARLKSCLQEIKAIAEDRTKTYDYLLGQEYTELVDKILDLITKAESEG